MSNIDELKKTYIKNHAELSFLYYNEHAMSKEVFDAKHGQLADNFEDDIKNATDHVPIPVEDPYTLIDQRLKELGLIR